jgi:hypothetical protein
MPTCWMHAVLLTGPPYLASLVHEDGQAICRCSTSVLVDMISSYHGRRVLWVTDEDMCLDASMN